MTGTKAPWPLGLQAPVFFQGWHPFATDALAAGFAGAGGAGVIRLPAFPDLESISRRLTEVCQSGKGHVGLDIRGALGEFSARLDSAAHNLASFLIHESDLLPERLEAVRSWGLPRLVVVRDGEEAAAAQQGGAAALLAAEGEGLADRLMRMIKASSLPCFAPVGSNAAEGHDLLARGASGLQLRAPSLLRNGAAEFLASFRKRLAEALGGHFESLVEKPAPALPSMRIRNLEVPYPIIQGGMGIGISWDRLAGTVASNGCVGIVSAIGTGYRYPGLAKTRAGRPDQPENLQNTEALKRILKDALAIAQGRGAVGVNILCAINEYERVVRESLEGGAQLIISGAGLPLSLPDYAKDYPEVALVPIVSSARALKLICKTWERKFNRLPDAVVLEGPESGGHQGFSLEQCTDPAFTLDALLPSVVQERDLWGHFPVIAAGGVWDRADIDRLMAIGAGGVQMGTRFIGTFECDAHLRFKEVILQSSKATIALHGSPVGMPARGVMTALHRRIIEGTAPKIKCVSNCVSPCEHGKGAIKVGYCIADSLGDSQGGDKHSGLFFTGSNGWKLDELIPVRDLVGEITEDYGLDRLAN